MKLENFKKLRVGDKIKFEYMHQDRLVIGKITGLSPDKNFNHVYVESAGKIGYIVTPRQVIAKIVKRKKPKLKFAGYVEQYIHEGLEVSYSSLCTEIGPFNTHEVFVRPIVRKK